MKQHMTTPKDELNSKHITSFLLQPSNAEPWEREAACQNKEAAIARWLRVAHAYVFQMAAAPGKLNLKYSTTTQLYHALGKLLVSVRRLIETKLYEHIACH